jgi:TonB family protein
MILFVSVTITSFPQDDDSGHQRNCNSAQRTITRLYGVFVGGMPMPSSETHRATEVNRSGMTGVKRYVSITSARTCIAVVCVCAFGVARPSAQCATTPTSLDALLAQDSVAILFAGTELSIAEAGPAEIVTFRAERVWKGPVTERVTIYRPTPMYRASPLPPDLSSANQDVNPTIFRRDARYVVTAHRLTDAERSDLGLSEHALFGMNMCGDGSRPISLADGTGFATLGPGRAPIDQRPMVRGVQVAPPIKIVDVLPDRSRVETAHGMVIIQITVDQTGVVRDPRIVRSIPVFDQPAIDAVLKWKFLPALINGVPAPVPLIVTIPVGEPLR